jgi:hypothetical protein
MSEPPCEECGRPANGEATPTELMDKPTEPWKLCTQCHHSLAGMKRVGKLRRLS